MVYGIGQTATGVAGIGASAYGFTRATQTYWKAPHVSEQEGARSLAHLFRRSSEEPLRAGFGDSSINGIAAAAKALDGGMEAAERVSPGVRDILETQQARRAAREESVERAERNPFRQATRQRIEATGRARNFVKGLNDVVGAAQARLGGEEPESAGTPARLTVFGETFDLERRPPGWTLDVLA